MTTTINTLNTLPFGTSNPYEHDVRIEGVSTFSAHLDIIGYTVGCSGPIPAAAGMDRRSLESVGFQGAVGQTLLLPRQGFPQTILVGMGDVTKHSPGSARDISAAFARATTRYSRIGLEFAPTHVAPEIRGQEITEGIMLARYRFQGLSNHSGNQSLELLQIHTPVEELDALNTGIERGRTTASATNFARDLVNTPANYLTASILGEFSSSLPAELGLDVEILGRQELTQLRCGGILGVNAGSTEDPCVIRLRYRPRGSDETPLDPTGLLALVGKGVMYDSGGISLKPSDPSHLSMKMDMAGAAAVLAAMTALRRLGCRAAVDAYLMCTDNMPSGSATKLGDVLTIRDGTTVEVKNTDAEGRLVLADGLALAREEDPDAIVDIATLTGAALGALGPAMAAVFGNNALVTDQVAAAAGRVGEHVWPMPLEQSYRSHLRSEVADLANIGGTYAGTITAALFLESFVAATPWAHLDIAGTMQSAEDDSWRSKGATGYGTRLLIDLAVNFKATYKRATET